MITVEKLDPAGSSQSADVGAPDREPHVRLENVSISFGDNHALCGVDLQIPPRAVVGLVGENGSGKSTLIKILNGVYRPGPGSRIHVRGQKIVPYENPTAFREHGISFVHQDLGLVPGISITENLLHEQILHARGPYVRWSRMHRIATDLLSRFGLDVDPRQPVSTLTDTDKALVAILRAVEELGTNKTLLVLDEPTVFLPRTGTQLLFRVVRRLLDEYDMSVLLVSHDLEEVIENTETIVVLKSGRVQGTVPSVEATPASLSERMVGRRVTGKRAPTSTRAGEITMAGRCLASGRATDVSFELRRGEVLGVTGLTGSGFEDVLPALYGASPIRSGSLTVSGTDIPIQGLTPRRALAAGIVYVPADRKAEGGMLELSAAENSVMSRLGTVIGPLGISRSKLAVHGQDFVQRYDVRPAHADKPFRSYSGGNQQKVVVGKWLDAAPSIILLQDPTQGVDVGARESINARLLEAAAKGAAIICATTDYEQLALICDRVLVIGDGTVVDELTGEEIERNEIATRVMRVHHDAPTTQKAG